MSQESDVCSTTSMYDIENRCIPDEIDLVYFNASFKEQCLPQIWKMADVTPLPKTKPVKELKKDLRPISLTACLSKVAEECVVVDYVKPAVVYCVT